MEFPRFSGDPATKAWPSVIIRAMRTVAALSWCLILVLLTAGSASAQVTAFVGGRLIDGTGRVSAERAHPEAKHALHMLRICYEADILGRDMFTPFEVGQKLARFDETGVWQ